MVLADLHPAIINKTLLNAHRKWSPLRKEFLKNGREANKISYNKQCSFCGNLLRKTKRDYYENRQENNVIGNKTQQTFQRCFNVVFRLI